MKVTFEFEIPKNPYKEETTPRLEIVKAICDALIVDANKDRPKGFNCGKRDHLYLNAARKNEGAWCTLLSVDSSKPYRNVWEFPQIRKCEMQMAFNAMHEASYLLYGEYECMNQEYTYVWSCKPLDAYECPPIFDAFID
jgi:hypothetical protein